MKGQVTNAIVRMIVGWFIASMMFTFLDEPFRNTIVVNCAALGTAAATTCNTLESIWNIAPIAIIILFALWAFMVAQKKEYDTGIIP